MSNMRKFGRPPKVVCTELPDGFSESFLSDLDAALPQYGEAFKSDYLRDKYLSSYSDPSTTPAPIRRAAAVEKWLSCERRNSSTNCRLFLNDEDFGWTTSIEFFTMVRRFIRKILGPMKYPDVLFDVQHTNGASTRIRRSPVSAIHKLDGNAHITDEAIKHWLPVACNTRLSSQTLLPFQCSELFTVPKTSIIDRVACKEPEVNMLLQRSVGAFIGSRLKKYGIDLRDQTVNQELARIAVRKRLATIDLSSASDSITTQLVINCLPFEWYSLLDDLRVKSTTIDGTPHTLEMFSSMGNGFTFELESLLFFAIASVVQKKSRFSGRISVYGDDIIVPCTVARRLIRLFHYLGFKTNRSKTFVSGAFRESCGKHYHGEVNVSPFFVKRKVSSLQDLIKSLNQLADWSGRDYGFIEDPNIVDFHRRYSDFVPQYLWGGSSLEDPTCLVTGHSPRFRLAPITRPVSYDQDLGLLHWFMSKENVDTHVCVESSRVVAFKAKRCSAGWLSSLDPWFILDKP